MRKRTAPEKSRPELPQTWSKEQVASLAGHFGLKPGMSMLDVGTCDGYALATWGPFCQPRGRFTALVKEEKLLAQTRRRVAALGSKAAVVVGGLDKLPFKDKSFDVVLAHTVLSNQKKPEALLDEMVRVTTRGGCVAVLDSARSAFFPLTWNNAQNPALGFRVYAHKMGMLIVKGRQETGHGNLAVGLHVPGWMEGRGLKNVEVRANERVSWQAPPYHSPSSGESIARARQELQGLTHAQGLKEHLRLMKFARAGGASRAEERRWLDEYRRYFARLKTAVRDGRFAAVSNPSLLCVWGFKP